MKSLFIVIVTMLYQSVPKFQSSITSFVVNLICIQPIFIIKYVIMAITDDPDHYWAIIPACPDCCLLFFLIFKDVIWICVVFLVVIMALV